MKHTTATLIGALIATTLATAPHAHAQLAPEIPEPTNPGPFTAPYDIARAAGPRNCEELRAAAHNHHLGTEGQVREVVREYNRIGTFHNPFGPLVPNPLERIMLAWTEHQWATTAVECGAVRPELSSGGITLGGMFASS